MHYRLAAQPPVLTQHNLLPTVPLNVLPPNAISAHRMGLGLAHPDTLHLAIVTGLGTGRWPGIFNVHNRKPFVCSGTVTLMSPVFFSFRAITLTSPEFLSFVAVTLTSPAFFCHTRKRPNFQRSLNPACPRAEGGAREAESQP